MANNFLVLVIFFSSSLFLSLDVNGDEIYNDRINKTSPAVSKKTKRAIEVENAVGRESNDLPPKDDQGPFSLSVAKRAPSGFTGMRGKKQFEYTDLSPNDLAWNFDEDYDSNDIRDKKAPSGFNGVRGKKMDQLDYEKSLLDQLLRRLYQQSDEQDDSSSFRSNIPLYLQGYSLNDEWDNSLDKRAPSGFTGMRGKRPLDFPFDGGKRAPNGFFGVRGKRDFKGSAAELFKYSNFFGMRGKKQPEFLGFRNKFVGVRGKKNVNAAAAINRLESQLLGVPGSSYRLTNRFLIDAPELQSFKRAPSGFLGMRGKRQVNQGDLNSFI